MLKLTFFPQAFLQRKTERHVPAEELKIKIYAFYFILLKRTSLACVSWLEIGLVKDYF